MEKINLRHLIPAASVFIIRARQTEKQTNKSHFPSKPSDALHLSVLIHPGSICVRVCEKVEAGALSGRAKSILQHEAGEGVASPAGPYHSARAEYHS